MNASGKGGPEGGPASRERCSFCGRSRSAGLELYRADGPDGAAVCWFCACSTVGMAARGELPAVTGRACSFCGGPRPGDGRRDGELLSTGPGGHALCPECAAMLIEASGLDDPALHSAPDPDGYGPAPPVW
ncbi:MAG: hypothetical protein LBR80_15740, partial [Deltaproteobacteria bacterium]|nr:hypothetical protein [Deltaproteobacteria bacterium]